MPGKGAVQNCPPDVVLPMSPLPAPPHTPLGAPAGQSSTLSAGTSLTKVQSTPALAVSDHPAAAPTAVHDAFGPGGAPRAQPMPTRSLVLVVRRVHVGCGEPASVVRSAAPAGLEVIPTHTLTWGQSSDASTAPSLPGST